jgi:transcription initiation factor TFIIIB Brf1 subunit/transcription initiation factor TFIIB
MTAGLKKITELAAVLNLHQQDFLKKSKEMLYRIEEEKTLKGRSIDSKVAMIIFLIARNLKRPKNVEDITKYLRTTKQEVNNCYKVLKKSNIFPSIETRL